MRKSFKKEKLQENLKNCMRKIFQGEKIKNKE